MTNFREVTKNDFEEIKSLYKNLLNFNMSKELYNYFYKKEDGYFSMVCEHNGKVIAHNAIIEKKYVAKNKEVVIGLSSGGMVNSDYSGVFFNLLRFCIKKFEGDGIIAFPNKNSELFFTKLLRFNTINDNYFTLKEKDLNTKFSSSYLLETKMSLNSINYRINNHPNNNYQKIESNSTFVIYKEFNNTVDIMYISEFNSDLIILLQNLFNKGYKEINLIYSDKNIVNQIGFKLKPNNVFTYKWINKDFKNIKFNCQMIDSDVF